jgi:hypothetical protein
VRTNILGRLAPPREVCNTMTRIVTTTYRYKRPPRKRKAVAIEVSVSGGAIIAGRPLAEPRHPA